MNTPTQSTTRPVSVTHRTDFLGIRKNNLLFVVNAIMAIVYFVYLTFYVRHGSEVLFYALLVGEVFHLWQILTYLYTVGQPEYFAPRDEHITTAVDVFITVAGEPVDIIEQTAAAAIGMDYPNHSVFILNDGYVAKKDNWKEVEQMAARLGITCITRTVPGGAKAGNINSGLRNSSAPLVAIFDADQVPNPDFLRKTIPYFVDKRMGFVQSPQYYHNHHKNEITTGSWEQQELFFGPVCRGKNNLNSTFMCGTNMVVRRSAFDEVGGMCETNIAEDFLTSLFVHEKGWKSFYVSEVLAEGLAPEDFLSYTKQQFRWARGSLEVMFRFNPLFRRGLSWDQKIQYLASASFYVSGLIVCVDAILPLVFLFTGHVALQMTSMTLAIIFLLYIFTTVAVLELTSNFCLTFRAISFSMSSFNIHIKAIAAVLTGQNSSFAVTSKKQLSGNFLYLVIPHMAYIALSVVGIGVAAFREGLSGAFLSNVAWTLFNCTVFLVFINAAISKPEATTNTSVLDATEGLPSGLKAPSSARSM